jgi:hypothetical protein
MKSLRTQILAVVFAGAATAAPPLESGKPLRVGTPDGIGPLSTGMSSAPLGAAYIFSSKYPDVFAAAGLHSTKPGMYLYQWIAMSKETGAPIFAEPIRVEHPFSGDVPPRGALVQDLKGAVHAFFLAKGKITVTRFDAEKKAFALQGKPVEVEDLQQSAGEIGAILNEDGSVQILLGVGDGVPLRPAEPKSWRDPNWYAFDGAGVFRGGFPYMTMYAAKLKSLEETLPAKISAKRIARTDKEALLSYDNITAINLGAGHERDVLAGSHFGNFIYYQNSSGGTELPAKKLAVSPDGIALRHPTIHASPISYFDREKQTSHLLVGGQGAIYYYGSARKFDANGAPIFNLPAFALQQNAELYTGSLPVLSVADWNGDGALDIIAGSSHGMILLFRNLGTNAQPAFSAGEAIESDGEAIQIQPGYWDIQGPQEARWGYTSPTVYDWNGDGLPDLLLSDATARHSVYLNRGTKGSPKLDKPRLLYCDGLEMHGTWRVKPGVGMLGGKLAYVTLDDQDEFHLYHRIDDYNLEDADKLKLSDGSNIRANFLAAGGTGRSKITIVDWDGDGKTDLLVGTPRHGSIPDPKNGLPQSLGLKGAAVIFLKNVGTNDKPTFAFPTMMKFKGSPIYLGQHECGPAPAFFNGTKDPDLLVGTEEGRIIYYKRSDLSWDEKGTR